MSTQKTSSKGFGVLIGVIVGIIAVIAIPVLVVFFTTVSVITYNIMGINSSNRTVVSDPFGPYLSSPKSMYSYFELPGSITARTRDFPAHYSVRADVIIAYDLDDQTAARELHERQHELRDFLRSYFSGKTAADLAPDREDALKTELREQLNTRFLDTARARMIFFTRLDVVEEL